MVELADLPVDPLDLLHTRRSAKWRSYPGDAIPLTVAEMDFALAPCIAEALHAAIDLSDMGYGNGAIGLAESLAAFAQRRWGWAIDPGQVTGVSDVATGVVQLFRVLTRPGDTIVINTPVYHPFFDWVADVGAKLRAVPLAHDAGGWHLDLDALEVAFVERPSVYLLCNPHNPVGRAHRREELIQVIRLAREYGVSVISDEIHAPLVHDGHTFTPILTLDGAPETAVSVLSASKAWNLAALKCALVVTAGPQMADVVGRISPDVRWQTGHFGVIAGIVAFQEGEQWLDQLLVTLGRRRAQLGRLLAEHLPMIEWSPPEATYLAWLDCRAIGSGDEPRDLFLEKGRVALESGPHFGAEGAGFVRLNFATSPEVLEAAVGQMARSLSDSGVRGSAGT